MIRNEVPLNEMKNVQEVFQREGFIGSAEAKKPIIATYGVGPCVGIAGYSAETGRGFVAHIDDLTDKDLFQKNRLSDRFVTSLGVVGYWGTKGLDEKRIKFDTRILQGQHNPGLIARVVDYLAMLNDYEDNGVEFNIVENDTESGFNFNGKSIALDLRTGQTYSYDPKKNPNRRDIGDLEMMATIMPSPIRWKFDESLKD